MFFLVFSNMSMNFYVKFYLINILVKIFTNISWILIYPNIYVGSSYRYNY